MHPECYSILVTFHESSTLGLFNCYIVQWFGFFFLHKTLLFRFFLLRHQAMTKDLNISQWLLFSTCHKYDDLLSPACGLAFALHVERKMNDLFGLNRSTSWVILKLSFVGYQEKLAYKLHEQSCYHESWQNNAKCILISIYYSANNIFHILSNTIPFMFRNN